MAKDKAAQTKIEIKFNQADIREITWENEFDAVLCINSAFNYMHTDEDAQRAIQNFYNALKPGGLAIVDLANFFKFFAEYKSEISSEHEKYGLIGKGWESTASRPRQPCSSMKKRARYLIVEEISSMRSMKCTN